ncbi:hypothetical protein QTQ03_16035 [Micromonospora sp. WMMA1363]|uniref:hypothetical protein n=1 Tax=Micromonospora sp. WMMA1363 TaxID=3053985 RepID=UPI00259CA464|nr:hypothetical protein [Micromonospora sp. WMMA1363]MDM4721031.1 hypothetical protein [Micromonospora sp. WMMA1363]
MLVLPIDGSQTLLVLAVPAPQFKDKANGVAATDRVTGAPLVEVPLALTVEGGTPQVLRVSVPQPSVPKDLAVGQMVQASGLTFVTGEKNGRAWQIFRASALTAVKAA